MRISNYLMILHVIIISAILVSHGAIQFTVYEELRALVVNNNNNNVISTSNDKDNFAAIEIIFISMISKAIASLVTYPSQVIRSRLQQQQMNSNNINYSSNNNNNNGDKHYKNIGNFSSNGNSTSPRTYSNVLVAVRNTFMNEGVQNMIVYLILSSLLYAFCHLDQFFL